MTPAVNDFTCSLTGDWCSLHQAAMLQKKSHGKKKQKKHVPTDLHSVSLQDKQQKQNLQTETRVAGWTSSGLGMLLLLRCPLRNSLFTAFSYPGEGKGYLYPFSILVRQELSSTTLLSYMYQSRGKSWGLTNLISSMIFPRPDATRSCSSAQRRTNDIMYKSRDLKSPEIRVQKFSLDASLPTQTPFITWMWLRKRRQLAL